MMTLFCYILYKEDNINSNVIFLMVNLVVLMVI